MSLFYPVIWLIAWLDIMFYVENNIPCTFLRQFDIVFSFWCRFDFSAIFCPWHSEILQCYPWSASQFSHSVMSDSLWPPWTAACQASLSFTMSWSLLKLMSIESLMPYNHLILCRPLHLLPSIFPSIRRPKYWSFSFSISTSNEYPGLISFRIDWFDLLAVQGTLKSLLQHSSSKASILQCSAFFMVQFDYPWYFLSNGNSCPSIWRNCIALFILSSFSPLLSLCDCYLGGRLSKLVLQISYHFSPIIHLFFFLLHFLKDCLIFTFHCFCSVSHFLLSYF